MEDTNSAEGDDSYDVDKIEESLDSFLLFYESQIPTMKIMNAEDIKKIFQVSIILEKTIGYHDEDEEQLKMWNDILETMVEKKQLTPKFDIDFFSKACDYALSKFFLLGEVFMTQTEIAVRIYTTLLAPKRFYTFLLNMLTESCAHQAIQEFIFENEDIEIKTLQYKLIIEDWIPEYEEGRSEQLIDVIRGMMKPYVCRQALKIVIGILAVETDSENEEPVRDLVLKEVLSAMCSRNKTSKDFWFGLFEVDPDILIRACEFSEDFHVSLCKFLIYHGTMMYMKEENGENKWCPISSSICPELTYDSMVQTFRLLSNVKFSRRNTTLKMIHKAEEDSLSPYWRQILDLL